MKLRRVVGWLGASVLFLSAPSVLAAPVVVDFGAGPYEFPTFGGMVYEEEGVRLSAADPLDNGITDPAVNGVGHVDLFDPTTYPGAGPDRIASVHTGNAGDIALFDFNGAAFQLLSIEIELFDEPSAGVWEIVASNGSRVTLTGTGTVSFDSSWAGITGFTIRSTSLADIDDASGNLYFDDITLLPEPASAALLACTIAGLRLARRRVAATA